MKYVYTIYSGQRDKVLNKFLASLNEHCKCKVLIVSPDLTQKNFDDLILNNVELNVKSISYTHWQNKRMFCKIIEILHLHLKEEDEVFVLDTDLIIQDDIFQVFEDKSFDIGITSRHYDYWYPINAGVWCFRVNKKTIEFLRFYVQQIEKPTWKPFVDFQKKFKHVGNLDWWCDQDFLCTVKDNKLPFDCNIRDIGYKYNFCPSVEEKIPTSYDKACEEIIRQVGNKDYKILHYKGRLKNIM